MAEGTVGGDLLIKLGIDVKNLQTGMAQAMGSINELKRGAENVRPAFEGASAALDALGSRAQRIFSIMTRRIIGPTLGIMSLTKAVKGYFDDVGKVAQETGAYDSKLEETRKKRALMSRITKEDIELYKKNREALTSFSIAVDDLGAKVMRSASPGIKFFAETLSKLSRWLSENGDAVARWIKIVAVLISTALTPSVLKLTAAMLANPIAWMIGLIIAISLAIEDFIVWLEGGESALDAFWSMFGSREQVMAALTAAANTMRAAFDFLWDALKTGLQYALELWDDWIVKTGVADAVISTLQSTAAALGRIFESIGAIAVAVFDAIVAGWKTVTAALQDSGAIDIFKDLFVGAINLVLGAWRAFVTALEAIFGLIRGIVTGDWSAFVEAVNGAIEAVKNAWSAFLGWFSALGDKIAAMVSKWLPDWAKDLLGIETSSEEKQAAADKRATVKESTKGYTGADMLDIFGDSKNAGGGSAGNSLTPAPASRDAMLATLDGAQAMLTGAVEAAVRSQRPDITIQQTNNQTVTLNTENPAAAQAALSGATSSLGNNAGETVAAAQRSVM